MGGEGVLPRCPVRLGSIGVRRSNVAKMPREAEGVDGDDVDAREGGRNNMRIA